MFLSNHCNTVQHFTTTWPWSNLERRKSKLNWTWNSYLKKTLVLTEKENASNIYNMLSYIKGMIKCWQISWSSCLDILCAMRNIFIIFIRFHVSERNRRSSHEFQIKLHIYFYISKHIFSSVTRCNKWKYIIKRKGTSITLKTFLAEYSWYHPNYVENIFFIVIIEQFIII